MGGIEGVPVRSKISRDAWACITPLESLYQEKCFCQEDEKAVGSPNARSSLKPSPDDLEPSTKLQPAELQSITNDTRTQTLENTLSVTELGFPYLLGNSIEPLRL